MESTTLDGAEAWRFYYEDSDEPQVTNIYEDASELWSGYLDQARYLSNGNEEILLQPRKDVASVYLPQSQTVIPYRYDPYGSQDSSSDSGYDLSDNPFRYTRELRDPVWGGIYLRARWYQPDLPIFLSRDPMDGQINHYGYAGGNPEMNVDPSGKSYKGFKRFVHKLDSGVGGHFSRLFLAPFLGPLEIAANPKGFWHQLKYDKGGVDLFLAAGILAEAVGPIGSLADPELFQAFSIETRFSVRLASDVTLGVGQTVAAAASSGSGHFSWKTFAKGMESTAGSIGDVRLVGGIGYRPFDMSGDNVATMIARENLQEGEALIFRRQMRLPGTLRQGGSLQEALHLGVYHEQLIGVTKDGYFTSDFFIDDGVRNKFFELSPEARAVGATNEDYLRVSFKTKSGSFQFVGKTTSFDTTNGFSTVDVPGFAVEGTFAKPPAPTSGFAKFANKFRISNDATGYNLFTNNCQYHAYAVRQYLGVR
jgi:RHS repeat-associated protein